MPNVTSQLIREAGDELQVAHELTSDPVWRAAERLPWIGPQLAAVGQVTAAGDDVSESALEPDRGAWPPPSRSVRCALSTAGSTSLRSSPPGAPRPPRLRRWSRPRNGSMGSTALCCFAPSARASPTLKSSSRRLRRPASAAELLPSMLGADGPRTWLLLFQNNAELRSLGGMPGATAVITADNGHLALTGQGTRSFRASTSRSSISRPELLGLYGERPAVWFSGTTILPDFAEAAPIAREMWRREHGVEADGVISLDPVALSYMLRATGPITLPTGETLTSDNAVDVLLNEVYLKYPDPVDQNAVFASAAATVFTAFTSGAADPVGPGRRARTGRRRAPAPPVEQHRRRAGALRRDRPVGRSFPSRMPRPPGSAST